KRSIFGFGPRFDGAFVERLRDIWDYQFEVEVNSVAESLTSRTSAIGIVKREQPGLRFLIANIADFAFETLRKSQLLSGLLVAGDDPEDDLACLSISDFHGINNSRTSFGRNCQPIDQHK